jgi:hypothetical protein
VQETVKAKWSVLFCAVLLFVGAASSWAELPKSEEEFGAQYSSYAEPETVANAFFAAVYVYTHADKSLGEDLLDLVIGSDQWEKTQPGFTTALKETPWVFDSYADGADAADGYAIDPNEFELSVANTTTTETELLGQGELACVYLDTAASDNPRPLILRRTEDGWKVASPTPLLIGLKSTDGNPGDDIAATKVMGDTVHLWLEATYMWILGLKDEGQFILDHLLSSEGYSSDIESMLGVAAQKPYIFYSYAQGTGPDDAYVSFDPFFFRVEITRDEKYGGKEDHRKAFIHSSGADSNRPFQCILTKRNQCRMYEYSTLRVDTRPPTVENW